MERSHRQRCPLVIGIAAALVAFSGPSSLVGAATSGTPLRVPAQGKTGFTLLSPVDTGIAFTNSVATERHITNQILLNGSGVALGDVDGDGRCDLYFCGLDERNALFRNQGDWEFKEDALSAGVACQGYDSTGAVFGDLDGDHDLDLVVSTLVKGVHVFLNDGRGRFSTFGAPFNLDRAGMSVALGDVDGDGDLDLYVANYRVTTIRDQPNTKFTMRMSNGEPRVAAVNGVPSTHPDVANRFDFRIEFRNGRGKVSHEENGEADVLYRNDGKGKFSPVSFTEGNFLDEEGRVLTRPPFDWGLSVMIRDLNGDRAPDIYVCNDFKSPDRVWMNQGGGRFKLIAPLAIRQSCLSSMGVDVADLNRDGYDDILVLDMLSRLHARRYSQHSIQEPEVLPVGRIENRPQYPRNTLLLNRGDGTYAEIARYAGLDATEWAWTPIFVDVDLDGYEDLLVSNGFERDGMNADVLMRLEQLKRQGNRSDVEQLELRKLFPRLNTGNLAFRNLGNLRFSEVSREWGFDLPAVSQGMAMADLDNDGDLDVVINNLGENCSVYRNETTAPRLAVRLKGRSPNGQGIGAVIRVSGGPQPQSQQIVSGGRYLSSDDALRVFAAGDAKARLQIEVTWPSGEVTTVSGAHANRLYEVAETESAAAVNETGEVQPWFEDVSGLAGHRHIDQEFDDFAEQPLLSKRLSLLGPGLSWFDLNGDGTDDLIVGAGQGGQMGVYLGDGGGGFERQRVQGQASIEADHAGVLAFGGSEGSVSMLLGLARNPSPPSLPGGVLKWDAREGTMRWAVSNLAENAGPMALADIDGDLDLDLFVGGRVIPGRYPEPPVSHLFRNSGGRFELDRENAGPLRKAGLVSGAVFGDLDGDGDPELILACEWGPLKVYRNDGGRFVEITESIGLDRYKGWWNGVTTGDFDGDGRMDLVASNWGHNTSYEWVKGSGLRLYYGDFDGNGTVESIEAYLDPVRREWMPLQSFQRVGKALPLLRETVRTFAAYSTASCEEIYGDALGESLDVNWLGSTIFLNRGGSFEARLLPLEAQLSPAFAVSVCDFNGDGREDVFLSQNFFATEPETSRHDAGLAVWLEGDGQGGFRAWKSAESGVRVYGEQRGAAVADFDGDGRVDVAVTQAGAETKLYRNVRAPRGLRVRVKGSPGNPHGVGAVLRLAGEGWVGPARELHAGSGYWSQDSPVQVLYSARPANRLEVVWPGGNRTSVKLDPDTRSIDVSQND